MKTHIRYIICERCGRRIKTHPDDYILDGGKFYCNDPKCHKQAVKA